MTKPLPISFSRLVRETTWAPLLVPLLSLLFTAAAAVLVSSTTGSRESARFEHAVDGASDRITARLNAYATVLRSGAAFMSASEDVTHDEFGIFVQRLRLDELYPGIQGFGYTARVEPERRDSLVAVLRGGPHPTFRLWPGTDPTAEAHAIVYLFPPDRRNAAAIGFDMYTERVRRTAMRQAWLSGRAQMSGNVTLVQEIEGPAQVGFLIYLPVYRTGEIPRTIAERERELDGFIYAPFRADDLFRGIFGLEASPLVAFRVLDGQLTSTADDALLHDSRVQGIAPSPTPRFETVRKLEMLGYPWEIRFASTEAFEESAEGGPLPILLGLGLGLTLVLFLVTRRQVAARESAERLARRLQETSAAQEAQVREIRSLNREIEEANRELASANVALVDSNQRLTELRQEADHARDEAHRANLAKSEFLAAMSHELRTPLNAITGYADLLDLGIYGALNEPQRDAISKIRRSQLHLLSLINDVLNHARLESGRIEARCDRLPLRPLLDDLRGMTEPQIREKGLQATFARPPASVVVRGDEDKIQQILLNLLTNAIKFTEPGGEIRVGSEAEDGAVRVHIQDTGPGIPADRLNVIFDPFVQIDRQVSRGSQLGVGLGLAISRDLARLMGGDITVESEVGAGSTFTLLLPAPEAQDASAGETAARERP